MKDREATIMRLWELSGHGARREDVEAAYEAGVAASVQLCESLMEDAERQSGAEAAGWLATVVERLRSGALAISHPDTARMNWLSTGPNFLAPEEVLNDGHDLRAFVDWCMAGNDAYDFKAPEHAATQTTAPSS